MIQNIKYISILTTTLLFVGCVPAPQPNITLGGIGGAIESSSKVPKIDRVYGTEPLRYTTSIPLYFSNKVARGDKSTYKYGTPKRAFRRKGLAYGGEVEWRGWLVETSIGTPTRTGRMQTPKPYMFLFSGEQIVDDVLGYSHKLITKVDK